LVVERSNDRGTETAVSIGLPVYNGARYIRSALTPLLGRTHTQLKLPVTDNASTDDSGEIVRELTRRDPWLRFIRREANRGPSAHLRFVEVEAGSEFCM
jgi:glycosyltransferase involved in cell wall biosynthesis